jgi:hypothetical protein
MTQQAADGGQALAEGHRTRPTLLLLLLLLLLQLQLPLLLLRWLLHCCS